jgi:hypothetical protein
MLRVVFVRTLKQGVSYQQFEAAWVPPSYGDAVAKARIRHYVGADRQVVAVIELDVVRGDLAAARALLLSEAFGRFGELVESTQLVAVSLVDDLTGSRADETVRFGLDGEDYEIDLSNAHAEKLRNALAGFIVAARPAQGGGKSAASAATGTIREWARRRGLGVGGHGPLPHAVVTAYRAQGGTRRPRRLSSPCGDGWA